MKAESDSHSDSRRELIGTLKYAGWIGLFVIIILCIVVLLGK